MQSPHSITVLLIDNYDSFTYNLYQALGSLTTVSVTVVRNDEITIEEIRANLPDAIVLSPGPGNPENQRDFGVCTDVIHELSAILPILGVCLGHQGMGLLLGGDVIKAPKIYHGKTSVITHSQSGIFESIPDKIEVARYHSLLIAAESIPDVLEVTATTLENEIMAIQHNEFPLYGVQFHPESFMTQYGTKMIQNFIQITRDYHQLVALAEGN